jgi:AraC-like DNA-binding protein
MSFGRALTCSHTIAAKSRTRSATFSGSLETPPSAGPWALRFPPIAMSSSGGVIEGARWFWIDGSSERVKLNAGDFYLLTDGRPYCFASDPASPVLEGVEVMAANVSDDGIVRIGAGHPHTVGAGGRFVFDQEMSGWLIELLPPVIVIRGDSPQAHSLRPTLELIQLETERVVQPRPSFAASLASIVLVNILRAHLASDVPPVGWLGALGDPKIGEALRHMHAEVQRNWKVADLAAAVSMSRTRFSERFRAKVGLPPLEYLTRWRMMLARQSLRRDRRRAWKSGDDRRSDRLPVRDGVQPCLQAVVRR